MRTTHGILIPGTEDDREVNPSCRGLAKCRTCRAETVVYTQSQLPEVYRAPKIAMNYKISTSHLWADVKSDFERMCQAGIISPELFLEIDNYISPRIKSS